MALAPRRFGAGGVVDGVGAVDDALAAGRAALGGRAEITRARIVGARGEPVDAADIGVYFATGEGVWRRLGRRRAGRGGERLRGRVQRTVHDVTPQCQRSRARQGNNTEGVRSVPSPDRPGQRRGVTRCVDGWRKENGGLRFANPPYGLRAAHAASVPEASLKKRAKMFRRFSDGFTLDAPEEVKSFLELLKIAAKSDEYKALVERTFSKEPNFETRKGLLLAGYFSRMDVFSLLRSVVPDARAGSALSRQF